MTLNLKVKVINDHIVERLEVAIQAWIDAEGIKPADVLRSEFSIVKDVDGYSYDSFATVLIWYISPKPKSEGK